MESRTIRLQKNTIKFYEQLAKKEGVSLSTMLRLTLEKVQYSEGFNTSDIECFYQCYKCSRVIKEEDCMYDLLSGKTVCKNCMRKEN